MVQTIGILGAGRVGSAIARTAVAAGYTVNIASSRLAADIEMMIEIVVPGAHAMSATDAVGHADLVIIAVPLHKYRSIPSELLDGHLVIDTMNYWSPIDGVLPEFEQLQTSSEVLAEYFVAARVVKTLNHIGYHDLEILSRPAGHPDRRALAIAGDDSADVATVSDVIERLGFDAVTTGSLRTGIALEPGHPIFGGHHTAAQLLRALPSDDSEQALSAAGQPYT